MVGRIAAAGLGLVLLALVALAGVDSCRKHQGTQNEQQAQQHIQEAEHHAGAAEALPDHKQELAQAQADVGRAQREVARLRGLLAAQAGAGVPGPARPDPATPEPVAPDHRDELLAADAVLITKLDDQVKGLQLALTDEQKRSFEWKATAEAREREAVGLRIALDAQKHVASSGKWVGRFQGLAVGLAGGYIAGRLR